MGTGEIFIVSAPGTAAGAPSKRQRVTRSGTVGVPRTNDGASRQPDGANLRRASSLFGAARRRRTVLDAQVWRIVGAMAHFVERTGGVAIARNLQLRTSRRSVPGVGRWRTPF